jgi:ribonuclease VapC
MIFDTSAILAIVLQEPGYEVLVEKVANSSALWIGAPTLAEAGILLENRIGKDASGVLVQFLHEWKISVIPFGSDHWREAVHTYSRYGKGKHKAALNFGDCLTYAVARMSRKPLLCTRNDFSKTDLQLA